MKRLAVFACLWALATSASAASVCDDLGRAVEDRTRLMAELTMDDSSPAVGEMKKSNALGEIQANLTLMQANKCTMPKAPVDYGPYLTQALKCNIARSAALRAGDHNLPAECDRDKWVRQMDKAK